MAKTAKVIEGGVCQQVAALPWRVGTNGRPEILLVTSRTNAKWMLPKGWPMKGKSAAESAEIEAFEEAGIEGEVGDEPIGFYCYLKLFSDGSTTPSQAMIYPLRVRTERNQWDEKGERQRQWFEPEEAARVVFEQDLARFLGDVAGERIVLA